jgi:hypothetical protein
MKYQLLEKFPHPKYPRLTIQLRNRSRFYRAMTFLDGKLRYHSLKTTHLPTAFKLAEDWYTRELRASVSFGLQHPIARLTNDPTIAELFASYSTSLSAPKKAYMQMRWSPIAHFWKARLLSTVDTSTFKDFFVWRRSHPVGLKNITLHKDVTAIRKILNYAIDQEMLPTLPRIPPVGAIAKNPRPWFTPVEWEHLLKVAEVRMCTARSVRTREHRRDGLEFMMFLQASMLRVDELRTLRYHACRIETNTDHDQLLLCEVSGKHGTRTCVANGTAAFIHEQRLQRGHAPTDLIFPHHCRNTFRGILTAAGLRENAQGFRRNLKSIRCTSISNALLNNPELNLMVVARNSGTSVSMVDSFYAQRLTAEMHKNELSKMSNGASAHLKAAIAMKGTA